MGKKARKGAGKGGAKGKPASAGGSKKVRQKHKTQQVAAGAKSQPKQQQNNGQGRNKAKALTPAERLAEMRRKIDGGKFRMLNEQLYTTTGGSAFSTFQDDPELFDVYHQGFREMADKWPTNPLDTFIDYVKRHPKAVVADFGCGDARLAESVPNKVHSFDLVSRKPSVTACNIADVPLKGSSVDIAVYCLALMGTSVREYVREVHRVLKPGGVLKVAEVKSRFESESLGGIEGFAQTLRHMGFDCKHKDERNKMFVLFEFVKSPRKPQNVGPIEFKACEYKRR
ncbi:25S rRNA (adenine645-N1)-methyltransferase [Phytophthora pseudosyringae]|uniref:Ribosomal RNA-processing protein 8 n=1 Tax=Phytophthora pseudosyringae TaxID=221518 RepID=A0A8T1VMC1_9STRA|nr:25S rRNA (adenine645-N1)-methyltransferase [Phytophthora pseudosyringae]